MYVVLRNFVAMIPLGRVGTPIECRASQQGNVTAGRHLEHARILAAELRRALVTPQERSPREPGDIHTAQNGPVFSLWTLQRSRVSIVCGPHTPKVLLMRCLRGSSQQSLCFCFLTLYQRLKDFSTSGQVEGRRASSHTLRQRPISPETIVAFHSSCRTSP